MKISIVEPKTPFFNFYSAFMRYLPLMGPIYLGSILKKDGHDVTIYNENVKHLDFKRIEDSDVLAISVMTSTAPRGYEIAQRFRALNPKGKIIIGGVHATFLPEEAALYADHVVCGEGELVISSLVRDGGERIIQGRPVEDLDQLPFPDFSLVHGLRNPMRITPISTSRGCPHDCTFCSVSPMFGRKYRFRSAESVIQELARSKHRHIFFYDDHFAANRSRTKRLVELMMQNGITAKWTAQVRADVAKDEELVQLMAKANCEQLCIGFESLDAETLKRYNKKQTPEDVRRCISVLHKYGIKVHGMFISEGYSDVYNKLGLDSLQLSILIPLIGSKLYSTVKNARQFVVRRFPSDWQLFDGSHVVHWPENISPVDMQRQTIQALKRFYSRHNAIMLFLKGQWRDSSIRFMGYRIIRKWEAQNRSYIGRLSQAQASIKVPSRGSSTRQSS